MFGKIRNLILEILYGTIISVNKKQRRALSVGLIIQINPSNRSVMTGFWIVAVGYFLLAQNREA
jgi:hypothetical protein